MDPTSVISAVGPLVGAVASLTNAAVRAAKSAGTPAATGQAAFQDYMDQAIARFVKGKDADRNGVLSLKEFGGDSQVFARYDLNGDGQLDAGELKGVFSHTEVSPVSGSPAARA